MSRNQIVVVVSQIDRMDWLSWNYNNSDFGSLLVQDFINRKPSGYELAAIKWAYEEGYQDIIIIQDSLLVKNPDLLQKAFDIKGSVSFTNKYQNYFGKFQSEVLNKIGIPDISTKRESVFHESMPGGFIDSYIQEAGEISTLCPEFVDGPKREVIFGKERMVIENKYFKKYKSCWHLDMIVEEE